MHTDSELAPLVLENLPGEQDSHVSGPSLLQIYPANSEQFMRTKENEGSLPEYKFCTAKQNVTLDALNADLFSDCVSLF